MIVIGSAGLTGRAFFLIMLLVYYITDRCIAATTIFKARAKAPFVGPGSITMDFIVDERARELITEENRRMTLMRTGTLFSKIVGRGVNITGIFATNILLPILLSEFQLNTDALL